MSALIPLFSEEPKLLGYYDEHFIRNCVKLRLATIIRDRKSVVANRFALLLKNERQLKVIQMGEAQLRKVEQKRLDASIEADRKGVIWWNGNDRRPGAMHRPGEACS